MAIDWDAEPDFIPPQNMVEISTVADAIALLDEWQAAYKDLTRQFRRLELDYLKLRNWAECTDTLAKNYEMLYERVLVDDEARAALAAGAAKG